MMSTHTHQHRQPQKHTRDDDFIYIVYIITHCSLHGSKLLSVNSFIHSIISSTWGVPKPSLNVYAQSYVHRSKLTVNHTGLECRLCLSAEPDGESLMNLQTSPLSQCCPSTPAASWLDLRAQTGSVDQAGDIPPPRCAPTAPCAPSDVTHHSHVGQTKHPMLRCG